MSCEGRRLTAFPFETPKGTPIVIRNAGHTIDTVMVYIQCYVFHIYCTDHRTESQGCTFHSQRPTFHVCSFDVDNSCRTAQTGMGLSTFQRASSASAVCGTRLLVIITQPRAVIINVLNKGVSCVLRDIVVVLESHGPRNCSPLLSPLLPPLAGAAK